LENDKVDCSEEKQDVITDFPHQDKSYLNIDEENFLKI